MCMCSKIRVTGQYFIHILSGSTVRTDVMGWSSCNLGLPETDFLSSHFFRKSFLKSDLLVVLVVASRYKDLAVRL